MNVTPLVRKRIVKSSQSKQFTVTLEESKEVFFHERRQEWINRNDNWYVFRDGKVADHRLFADETCIERLNAHWLGYLETKS
jgi:hypothetical protein